MLSLLFIILAAIINAAMDTLNARYHTSVFKTSNPTLNKFFNPALSWQNKWKNGDRKQGELFFGSSTFLVWTTDAWHLFKTLMLACYSIAIVTYSPMIHPIVDAIAYWIVFGIVFELFWAKIFLKNYI
jgi:hypothetical protein